MKKSNDDLLVELYYARKQANEARTARNKMREEAGQCRHADSRDRAPCWQEEGEPCDACKEVMPLYDDMVMKRRRAGTLLRMLMIRAEKMAKIP